MEQKNKFIAWLINNPFLPIIIVSLCVHLITAGLYRHITMYPDSEDYIHLAERLLLLDLGGYQGERTPGYPLLLCLTGLYEPATVVLQMLIGICTLLLAYKTMVRVGVRREYALYTTLFLCCYLPAVFFEMAILTETLTAFVVLFIFHQFFHIILSKEKKKTNFLLLILSCAYLVMIKPFYIFLPFLLFIILLLQERNIKCVLFKRICLLILPLAVFLGWSYVNKVNTGYFVSTTFYGFNLAQNCVSFAENTSPEYEEIGQIYAKYRDNRISDKEEAMVIWEAYPELQKKTKLAFPGLSKLLYDYSLATIKENRLKYLKQVFFSWCDFWKTSMYWERHSFDVPEAERAFVYLAYAERVGMQMLKLMFMFLIPYNMIRFYRKGKINPPFVISAVILGVSLLQALVTYGTNSRFSFPFEILMVISVALNLKSYIRFKRILKAAR